jgi:purine-binding chemotaxis protein CheW
MAGQALVKAGSAEVVAQSAENLSEFVTFNIADQLFGIPVLIVQDILLPENIASIPLAPPEVRGSINLRGRIVTVIDVRVRLGLERRDIASARTAAQLEQRIVDEAAQADARAIAAGGTAMSDAEHAAAAEERAHEAIESAKRKRREHMMAVTVEHKNDLYTLLVDSVGDVISLSKKSYEGNPSTLDPLWREFASGVYRLDKQLMVVLDVDRLLDLKGQAA